MPNNYSQDNIVALANQAGIAISNRAYPEALDAYGSAVKLARDQGRSRLVAVLLNRIGDTFQAQGEVQDAVIAYEAALQALESKDEFQVDSVIDRLSRVSKGFYSNPETIPDLYSAEVLHTLEAEENDRALPIKLWLDVGNAYLRQPQEGPALNAYQQAMTYPEIHAQPLLQAYAIANMGEIHRRQGNLDLAETELQQALHLFEAAGKPLEKRRTLAFLAALKRNRQQVAEAEALYQQALSLYDQAKDDLGKGRTLAGLARLYLEQKRFQEAQSGYEQAKVIAQGNNDQEVLGYCYWGLGCCYQAVGELKQAIASFKACLNLIELRQQDLLTDEGKVSFIDSIKDLFDRLLIAHLDLAQKTGGDYQAALEVAENARGRALQDLMQGCQRRRPKLQSDSPTSADRPRQQEQQQIQQAAGTTVYLPQWELDDDIVRTDAPPLARLVFYVLLDRTATFAVTPDGKVSGHVSSVGCHDLEQQVAQLRRTMQVDEAARGLERKLVVVDDSPELVDVSPISLEAQLQQFYTDFIAPVAEALPADGAPVVVEPHSALWLLPFAALKLPDGSWMGDRWPLLYAPSAQTLDEIRTEPAYASLEASKILIVGNPKMPIVPTQDGVELTLSELPGAEQEAHSIAAALADYDPVLLIGPEATEAEVKELAQTHNWLHLATHGIAYATDPLASFVAFSPTDTENGLLTAREVAQNRALPADLVVLSACQTGLGRVSGDGMLGLSRAFLIAGARTVVVSQWSVSDQATAELMRAFYQHYLDSGNKAIALQHAMQTVRSIDEFNHPRYWTAFLLIGDYK